MKGKEGVKNGCEGGIKKVGPIEEMRGVKGKELAWNVFTF